MSALVLTVLVFALLSAGALRTWAACHAAARADDEQARIAERPAAEIVDLDAYRLTRNLTSEESRNHA